MNRIVFLVLILLAGCAQQSQIQPLSDDEKRVGGATKQQELAILALIDQLVFAAGDATNEPVMSPGIDDHSANYRMRYESCRNAFTKLMELKGVAIPILAEHLDDKRQSIDFRNHYLGNSVGDACHWNIYFQLVDQPEDYSEYGYKREGRDRNDHPKPYWEGTPFDDAGGLKKWLEKNKDLNYLEMQIKCLRWLLEGEKQIGASDAESYFLNILPLEIRILERRLENGEDVQSELNRMMKIRDKKLADQIPEELLPSN